ncbi:suppressor of fused domain protein [Sphingobacterium sp. lm-10]|uniref:suppressor of fused domain protein n=1 Tax=Sphingobacterium sp. lm-10 TaxID=2944904 RepID=UPI0020210834|nr:suppressor of fused domain protein [Sphingobacterium sp. lm-10]MCL7987215.1 suppressor of fused domain protein [Sphingobacterium sp. lm-10]
MSLFRKPYFMRSGVERFRDLLEKEIGDACEVYRHPSSSRKLPTVFVLIFKNFPSPGYLTAYSYGLSAANGISKQMHGRELVLQIKSEVKNWGHVLGFLINHLRGDCPFDPGQIIRFGQPIAADSQMEHFIVHDVDKELGTSTTFNLSNRYSLELVQLSPIYGDELMVIDKMGWSNFFHRLHPTKHEVNRKPIGAYK